MTPPTDLDNLRQLADDMHSRADLAYTLEANIANLTAEIERRKTVN